MRGSDCMSFYLMPGACWNPSGPVSFPPMGLTGGIVPHSRESMMDAFVKSEICVLTPLDPDRLQAEKSELNWLLNSGALGRSSNLARMLIFACEKHFQGLDDQVTEHSIATEALGRRDDFDPQTDTIVRVTAHSLRKRLQEIYQTEGVNRPLHIHIPLGNYMPSFVLLGTYHALEDVQNAHASAASGPEQVLTRAHPAAVTPQPKRLSRWLVAAASLLVVILIQEVLLADKSEHSG